MIVSFVRLNFVEVSIRCFCELNVFFLSVLGGSRSSMGWRHFEGNMSLYFFVGRCGFMLDDVRPLNL